MVRKWNEADHPRDGDGRFTDGGGRLSTDRSAWGAGHSSTGRSGWDWADRTMGQAGYSPAAPDSGGSRGRNSRRDAYNNEMLEEAVSYEEANEDYDPDEADGLDTTRDDDLHSLIYDLRRAIESSNHAKADALADEIRRYLVANGYTDEEDLPDLPA